MREGESIIHMGKLVVTIVVTAVVKASDTQSNTTMIYMTPATPMIAMYTKNEIIFMGMTNAGEYRIM